MQVHIANALAPSSFAVFPLSNRITTVTDVSNIYTFDIRIPAPIYMPLKYNMIFNKA